jgi:hypothetical protein
MAGNLHGRPVGPTSEEHGVTPSHDNPSQDPQPGAGLGGTLKFIGVLAILLLAMVGILFALDLMPREALSEAAGKALLVLVIVAIAVVAIGLLMGRRRAG